jgi:hypothetical protein
MGTDVAAVAVECDTILEVGRVVALLAELGNAWSGRNLWTV